jgi:hypothetical protein
MESYDFPPEAFAIAPVHSKRNFRCCKFLVLADRQKQCQARQLKDEKRILRRPEAGGIEANHTRKVSRDRNTQNRRLRRIPAII